MIADAIKCNQTRRKEDKNHFPSQNTDYIKKGIKLRLHAYRTNILLSKGDEIDENPNLVKYLILKKKGGKVVDREDEIQRKIKALFIHVWYAFTLS